MVTALLVLALAGLAGPSSPDFEACMAKAHAMRPRQHCQSVEIGRRSVLIDQAVAVAIATHPREQERLKGAQALWSSETDRRCFALARQNRGSLGSMKAMPCRLDAQEKRLDALGRPLGS